MLERVMVMITGGSETQWKILPKNLKESLSVFTEKKIDGRKGEKNVFCAECLLFFKLIINLNKLGGL